ncbi:MAG: acetolactate synthase small subunit [Oscillospiraceae bacterium]|jgi:acetolactate synthase-1/3 small subunit|nr:acetolactate synthase small subunit [Oscillospiraceae bacterium]
MDRHVLSLLVDNSAGVLERTAGLISRRGFNIDSLSVGETGDPRFSRMTIIVTCDARAQDQIVGQLLKQVFVKKLQVLPSDSRVMRELLLVKVSTAPGKRAEILDIANVFRAKAIDVCADSLTLEITGEIDKSEALIRILNEFGILEITRTGSTALCRGSETIYDSKPPEISGDFE